MDLTNYPLAIVYNVFPHSPVSEQTTHLKSQQPDSHSAEGLKKAEHLNSFLQGHKTSDCAEETHQQQPEGEQSSADGSSPMISSSRQFSPLSPSASSDLSSISPLQQGEEGEGASCPQCTLVVADTQTGASLENFN